MLSIKNILTLVFTKKKLNETGTRIIQLLTFGGLGIWALIDLIIIITGNFKDSQGNLIQNI